jgi:uncharacterized protein DUF1573
MRRLLFISLLAIAACKNTNETKTNDPNKLPASLVSNPHTAGGVDNVAAELKPVMSFKDTLHEFGTIHEAEVVEYDFSFTNTGKTPLVITSATGSCGCTVPSYPHDPVAPGASAIMKVTFNSAGKSGHQEKSVAIRTNTLRATEMLYIKADIAKKE